MSESPTPSPPPSTGRRLLAALRSRPTRGQAAVAALCGLLAFALVTQVHATANGGGLQAARADDLLGILSDLDNRGDRLRAEILDLQAREQRLSNGSGQSAATTGSIIPPPGVTPPRLIMQRRRKRHCPEIIR